MKAGQIPVVRLAAAALLCVGLAGAVVVGAEEPPKATIPQPGVPEIMTLDGRCIQVAYNDEGYAIIGYKVANLSVGEPWMLLDIGLALRDKVPNQVLKRDALSLETPDGKTIPLASVAEYRKAPLDALQERARFQSEPINIFPPNATAYCRLWFFADVDSVAMAWDQVSFTERQYCLGRLFFQVPGGIAYGQHWLNVKFANSLVRVPFRILTREEAKVLDTNYKSIEEQVKAAFAPPAKKP